MEIFTFLKMGASLDRITVLPIADPAAESAAAEHAAAELAAAERERQSAALEQQWWDMILDDDDVVLDAVAETHTQPSSPQSIAERVVARRTAHRFPAGSSVPVLCHVKRAASKRVAAAAATTCSVHSRRRRGVRGGRRGHRSQC